MSDQHDAGPFWRCSERGCRNGTWLILVLLCALAWGAGFVIAGAVLA